MENETPPFDRQTLETLVYGAKQDGVYSPGIYGEYIQVNTSRGEKIIGRCDGFDQPILDLGRYASAHFIVTSNGGEVTTRRYLPINTIDAIWKHRPLRWEGDDN
jgi:hypothetical protein